MFWNEMNSLMMMIRIFMVII